VFIYWVGPSNFSPFDICRTALSIALVIHVSFPPPPVDLMFLGFLPQEAEEILDIEIIVRTPPLLLLKETLPPCS